ncbi:hypothetical protein Aca07nite_32000 [Actinoplanes capillaceus]|uniref:AbiEi antitoxin N-terminal domain-containing protein n=1 Tax=Actinoplanes campanulatus TaxID=113559 RepID=A0ABQ3WI77_9ACTN|nr:type IV toxin-antitoxin system AbiEi family antitoxin domain-containing protein [Actinoplanes capillaceus]GID45925.1 hypothetical protein Aca07nite_32000 [Actinoplanes capillaceus]
MSRAFQPDRETPLAPLLRRQQRVISWRQARRHLSESTICHRVESGRWFRVHRGVYLTNDGPVSEPQTWWIASLAVGNGRPALLAGVTALRIVGLRLPVDAEPIHILLPAHLTDRDPPPDVVVHRTRHLPRTDVLFRTSPPCTTAARSLVDAAQWAFTDSAAIALIATAFQQRLVNSGQVKAVLGGNPRLRRRTVIEAAVADAGGGSESPYEIEFLRLCRRAGLPKPSRQAARLDRSGRNRYSDVFFDPWRVQVEIDGSQHMEVRGWYDDMRSGNEIAISGVRLLRFPGWAIRHRPYEVVADVRAALRAAGWRGTTPAIGLWDAA